MRKILAILSVLVLAQAANAENNLSTSAELRTRVQNDMNATGNEDTGLSENAWSSRLKLGLDFNAGEKLSMHATLLHNSAWGQELGADGETGPDSAVGVRDGLSGQNLLMVQEAYGTWMLNDSTSIRLGRGAFTLADGSVVSSNDWEANPLAFEGLMITHDMEFGRVSGFYVKASDFANTATTVDDPEGSLYGLSLDVKSVPDMIKMLNVHVIQSAKDELAGNAVGVGAFVPGKSFMRYGLTVAGETSGADFKFTYASESGDIRLDNTSASTGALASIMMDLDLGYTLEDIMGLRVGFQYHSDTGSNASTAAGDSDMYDGFYYDTHANAGAMDIFEWGNLTYMGVNLSAKPMDNTTVGFDYYMFSQTEKDGGNNTGTNGGAFASADVAEDELGTEMDLWAAHKYDNGLEMMARYSMFTPGAEYEAAGLEDSYTSIFVEAKMSF